MTRGAVLLACATLALSCVCTAVGQEEAGNVAFEHGFRYDPMEFAENGDTLQAAAVRKVILERPRAGDEEILAAHFAEVFAAQKPDGHLEQQHHTGARATAEKLLGLLDLGCSPDRPEFRRALDALARAADELPAEENIGCRELLVLCVTGRNDHPAIKRSLEGLAAGTVEGLGGGDPGLPMAQLMALWAGRELGDVGDAIETILAWLEDAVEPPGCSKKLGLCEPWGLVDMAGLVDHPAAARVIWTLVPMLLRMQEPDGGWGEGWWIGGEKHSTIFAFRALNKHGLLQELRALPPLPPDWKVVRSLPVPCEKPMNIEWVDGSLWVLDGPNWAAIAVSPDDGAVLKTVKLADRPGLQKHVGFGAGDGTFCFAASDEQRGHTIYEMSADTGQVVREIPVPGHLHVAAVVRVGGKLLISDGFEGGAWLLDPDQPDAEPQRVRVAAGMPDYLAAHGDQLWCVDWWAPAIIRTNMDGELLDWGEKPFGFSPIAWDGQHLWTLDAENSRICLIENASQAR